MSATAIDGLTGVITLPGGLIQFISSITITTGSDLLDVSHYGGLGWRSRIAGIKDLAGQCVCFMTTGNGTNSSPFGISTVPSSMTILYATGCSITFNAIIGNTQVVGEYQGLNIVTFSYSHSGDGTDVQVSWS